MNNRAIESLTPPYRKRPLPASTMSQQRLLHLVDVIESEIPLPSHLPRWLYTPLAQILMRQHYGMRMHKVDQSALALSRDNLRRWFIGQQRVKEIVPRYFTTTGWYSHSGGLTKPYKQHPRIWQAISKAELGYRPLPSRVFEPLPSNNQPWMPTSIPVDVESLERLLADAEYVLGKAFKGGVQLPVQYLELDSTVLSGIEHKAPAIQKLTKTILGLVNSTGGLLYAEYTQSVAGRYYATGTNLQNCYSIIKHAALNGAFEYDIKACHHAVMFHHAKKYSLSREVLAVYIDDPDGFRIELAAQLETNVDTVKLALIIMIYGAENHSFGELRNVLGEEVHERAKSNKLYQGLYLELRTIGDDMLARAEVLNDEAGRTWLLNLSGRPFLLNGTKGKSNRSKQLAHLMQCIESHMLKAMAGIYRSVIQLEHDGVSALYEESPQEGAAAIRDATGIVVQITSNQHRLLAK